MLTYTFLSGGTGTPKLMQGFRQIIDDHQIGVICNTGDDMIWNQLHISPDLDTVLYLFSGKLDLTKFWGVTNESFHALETLKSLDEPVWFNIGDRDLGLHLYRSSALKDRTLSQITEDICDVWNIKATILPMSDAPLRSMIHTDIGILPFQEYFVKHGWQPEVEKVRFEGETDQIPTQVEQLLSRTNDLIIGPSNPITSIGPMLALDPINLYLRNNRDKVVAISPIEGNNAFSGPSATLMKAMNIEVSVVGLAKHYANHISKLVISMEDAQYREEIEDVGIEPILLPIKLQTEQQKKELAQSLIDIL